MRFPFRIRKEEKSDASYFADYQELEQTQGIEAAQKFLETIPKDIAERLQKDLVFGERLRALFQNTTQDDRFGPGVEEYFQAELGDSWRKIHFAGPVATIEDAKKIVASLKKRQAKNKPLTDSSPS